MAHELTRFEMLKGAGAIPRTLIIRVKHIARRVHGDAARRADAAARRDHFAIRGDPQTPAAELAVAGKRSRQTQHYPEIALLVEARAESVFVIVAADAPFVVDDLEDVGLAV